MWAAAGRGPRAPLFGLALVFGVAAGVFVISRLLGYVVLERMWVVCAYTPAGRTS